MSSDRRDPAVRPLNIVYLTLGLFSYLHRAYPMARLALERGHRFTLVSADGPAVDYTRAQGIDAVLLERQSAAWDATFPETYWPHGGRVLHKIPGLRFGPRAEARQTATARRALRLDTEELVATVRGLDADVVVTECEQHRDIRALLGAGLRVVTIDDHYGTRPGPDSPHAGSSRIPTGTPISRIRSFLGWESHLLGARLKLGAEKWWLGGNDPHSVYAELSSREGIDPESISRRSYMYHHYRDVPTIRPLVEELFYEGEDRDAIITGPMVDEKRTDHLIDDDFAYRWAEITDRAAAGTEPRIVYMSFGTLLKDQTRLITELVDGLGGRSDISVVLAIGPDRDHWGSRSVPTNVHIFSRVPQLEVLARADVMVSAGGPATVHEALFHGVPLVFVSGKGVGQDGLIARAVGAGIGVRIRPRQVTATRIAEQVDRVLEDEAMRARVAALGRELRARDGAALTVDALERLAA